MSSFFLFVSLIGFTSCGGKKSALKFSLGKVGDSTEIQKNPVKEDPAWLSVKKNLIDASCLKCHNADTANRKNRLDLSKREIVFSNYDDILYRMTDAFDTGMDYMPPKGARVAPEVIQEFKNWYSDAGHN